ncbi:MAG: hypothetical protein FWD32_02810 [Firmicutes bacterium]|nr:hypothetical protein [Bacillota bacterium]
MHILEDDIFKHQVLTAICKDDCLAFSKYVDKSRRVLSLQFGRFTLIALLYLFNAKKIIRNYQDDILRVKDTTLVEEPAESYKRFKEIAGTSLRHFGAESTVTKQDMINLLSLNQKPLGVLKISLLYTAAVVPLIFAIVFCFFASTINSFGTGTLQNPYKVYNAVQFYNIAQSNTTKHYVLTKNLTLPQGFNVEEFSANLNGGGKTITINSTTTFANKITGSISHITFAFGNLEKEIFKDFAFLTLQNDGTIKDVAITVTAQLVGNYSEGEVYVAGFAAENNGDIENSIFHGSINFISNTTNDAFFTGFAGVNNGNITNSKTLAPSTFSTVHVDIAGIAIINNGVISGCTNNAFLSQTASSNFWFPNAAGIATENNGVIKQSKNLGDIFIESSAICEIYIGGVVAFNYGEIDNCGNESNIQVEHIENTYVFLGGVVGYAISGSTVKNCFTIMQFDFEDKPRAYSGGIIGITHATYSIEFSTWFIHLVLSNNFYYANTANGIAILHDDFGALYIGGNMAGGAEKKNTEDGIRELSLYF